MGASVAYAAAEGLSTVEVVEEGSFSSRGIAPPMSSHTDAAAEASTAAGRNPPSERLSTFIAEAYIVEEDQETPGRGTVYEAELIEPQLPLIVPAEPQNVLPFYQRKGFVVVVTLLAIGALAGVLLSNVIRGNTGGPKAPSDDTLVPVPGPGSAAPQTSSFPEDPAKGGGTFGLEETTLFSTPDAQQQQPVVVVDGNEAKDGAN